MAQLWPLGSCVLCAERFCTETFKANSFSTLLLDCQNVSLHEYESGFSPEVVESSVNLPRESNERFMDTHLHIFTYTNTDRQADVHVHTCTRAHLRRCKVTTPHGDPCLSIPITISQVAAFKNTTGMFNLC